MELLEVNCIKEQKVSELRGARKDERAKHTLEVGLVVLLGGLRALLSLEPDQTELVLDIVDHGGLTLATFIIVAVLSGGVGTLELEVLAGTLQILAAVTLPKDIELLVGNKLEGIGDDLVTGNDVLVGLSVEIHLQTKRGKSNLILTDIQCR